MKKKGFFLTALAIVFLSISVVAPKGFSTDVSAQAGKQRVAARREEAVRNQKWRVKGET